MLPAFPDFKPLDWTDRSAIQALTSQFPPYSEFNVVNMWCWSSKYRALCQLNDHLVEMIADADTGETALSVLGKGDTAATLVTLLDAARELECVPRLRLVPEEVLAADARLIGRFVLHPEDHDSDHVLSIPDWVTLQGSAYQTIRNHISAFRRRHRSEFCRLDLSDPAIQVAMEELFWRWAQQKNAVELPATWHELVAIRRLFMIAGEARLVAFGVRADDRLIGFLVCECWSPGWAIAHYWKGDRTYRGIYSAVLHQACQELLADGFVVLNIGQDLGLPGLASAKRSFQPCRQLRKFAVAAA